MIYIRPYRAGDAEPLFAAVDESRAILSDWLPWCHEGYSIEDSRQWVEAQLTAFPAGAMYSFVICDERGFLGGCGLNRIEKADRFANLGYWVRSSAQRRGVASEAVRQLARWAFSHTDLERLEVLVSSENRASQRVAEKSGAVKEGLLRKRIVLKGRSHDCIVYSIVRGDQQLR